MPFTLAHPAAVLPLRRLPCLATIPLILGSLTPDFVTYFPLTIHRSFDLPHAHSVRGTVLLDLPLGYAVLLVLLALRVQLTAPLWEPHRSFIRAAFTEFLAMKYWWLVAIPSLLIGSWTHILWDSFTHENRWVVRNFPLLQQALAPEYDHPLPIYRVLQYVCSIVGLLIVAAWYGVALKQSGLQGTGHRWRKYTLAGLLAGAMIIGAAHVWHISPTMTLSFYGTIAALLSTAMAAFAALYLLTGIVIEMKSNKRVT
jgi:hypothetical protein